MPKMIKGAALVSCAIFFQFAQAQDSPQVQIFKASTIAKAVDERCEVLTYGQSRALDYLNDTVSQLLSQQFGGEAVKSTRGQLISEVEAMGGGCLPREGNEGLWGNIDIAQVMADAVIAAPAYMPAEIESCKTFEHSQTPITRQEMSAAKAAIDPEYAASSFKPMYEQMRASIVADITTGCSTEGVSKILQGVSGYTYRQSAISDDATPFGAWRNRVEMSDFFSDYYQLVAYRTDDSPNGETVVLNLRANGTCSNHGNMKINRSGEWKVTLSGSVDTLQIKPSGQEGFNFTKTSREDEGGFLGESRFILPAEARDALLAMPDETELVMLYQPQGGRFYQFLSSGSDPGKTTVGLLKQAIAWSTAPRPVE